MIKLLLNLLYLIFINSIVTLQVLHGFLSLSPGFKTIASWYWNHFQPPNMSRTAVLSYAQKGIIKRNIDSADQSSREISYLTSDVFDIMNWHQSEIPLAVQDRFMQDFYRAVLRAQLERTGKYFTSFVNCCNSCACFSITSRSNV